MSRAGWKLILGMVCAGLVVGAVAGLATRKSSPPPPSTEEILEVLEPSSRQMAAAARRLKLGREPRNAGRIPHYHAAVQLVINGAVYGAPPNLGLIDAGRALAVHTHDRTGLIHLHLPPARRFTLGELLELWGIPLREDGIGPWSFSNGWQAALYDRERKVELSGKVVLGNFSDYVLELASPGAPLTGRRPVPLFDWKTAATRFNR